MSQISTRNLSRMIRRAAPDVAWPDDRLAAAAGILGPAIDQARAASRPIVLAALRREADAAGLLRVEREAVVQAARQTRRVRHPQIAPHLADAATPRRGPAPAPLDADALPLLAEIEREREARGWTRARMAEQMGMTRSAYSEVASGRRAVSSTAMQRAAEAMGLRWSLTE